MRIIEIMFQICFVVIVGLLVSTSSAFAPRKSIRIDDDDDTVATMINPANNSPEDGQFAVNCVNPPESQLSDMLAEYKKSFARYTDRYMAVKSRQGSHRHQAAAHLTDEQMNEFYLDDGRCDPEKGGFAAKNRTQPNELSLCPWENVITHRKNRYPHYVNEVRCLCRKCAASSFSGGLDERGLGGVNEYACRPLLAHRPVLVKGECKTDGFYQWRPELELIAELCACGQLNYYYPL